MQKAMQAIVKAKPEPGLWLEQVPVPEVGPDDVLIRTKRASICGTDIHIYNWDDWAQKTIPVPMTIGHEFVGEIVSVGTNVRGFAQGDLVVGEGHITCGHCRNCLAGRRHLCPNTLGVGVNRPGAWAEFVSIPASNTWHADPSILLDVLSCFDPLGNAVHTALTFDLVGEDVLITGAGPIGCMALANRPHAGRPPHRHHRRQSLSPRSRPENGCDAGARCAHRKISGCDDAARNEGRFRCLPGDVG